MIGWEKTRVVCAAGVYGASWSNDNQLVVTSPDGYSITPPQPDSRQKNRLGNSLPINAGFIDNISYQTAKYAEPLEMFNWDNPVGKFETADGWILSLQKNGTHEIVILKHRLANPTYQEIALERLEDFELSFSFSPNDQFFAIVGSGGAEIFKRK